MILSDNLRPLFFQQCKCEKKKRAEKWHLKFGWFGFKYGGNQQEYGSTIDLQIITKTCAYISSIFSTGFRITGRCFFNFPLTS